MEKTDKKVLNPFEDKDYDWKVAYKVRIDKIRRDVENFKREKRKELQTMRRSYYENNEKKQRSEE